MRLTQQQYELIQRRLEAGRKLPTAVPQPPIRNESLAEAGGKEAMPGRFLVRITSHRTRLLDLDNLYAGAKYLCDCLRMATIIPDDNPSAIDLKVEQVKVKKADEKTVVEIMPI